MPHISKVGSPRPIRAASLADECLLPLLLPNFRPTHRGRWRCKGKELTISTNSSSWHQAEATFYSTISFLCQVHKHEGSAKLSTPQSFILLPRTEQFTKSADRRKLYKISGNNVINPGSVALGRQKPLHVQSRWQKKHSERGFIAPSIGGSASGITRTLRSSLLRVSPSAGQDLYPKARAFTSQAQAERTDKHTDEGHEHQSERFHAEHDSSIFVSGGSATDKPGAVRPESGNVSPLYQEQSGLANGSAKDVKTYDTRVQQLGMLRKIKTLEEQLRRARRNLKASLDEDEPLTFQAAAEQNIGMSNQVSLTKQHYVNMVDLYYYTPLKETITSPTHSPNPLLFRETAGEQLSRRFDVRDKSDVDLEPELDIAVDPDFHARVLAELREFESQFREGSLSSNSLLEPFITALLLEKSQPRRLFQLYQKFPKPGVAYLPSAAIRLFLYRMSTNTDKRSEANMVRYLSIIDDMQLANLPIAISEWSSAIYLAGRAFWQVTQFDLGRSIEMWKRMEHDAGVQASNVTFNILFDISVKAKKFLFAERVLKEMLHRGLHLNRLGRVSFIWYQGWLGDGDAVRRAYRDLVDAGEIVDTLVLNCVMVSLIRAQEPAAAEQIYERMKALQEDVRRYLNRKQALDSVQGEVDELPSVVQYPPPGPGTIGQEYASNHLGRVLLRASKLAMKMPELHKKLQDSMPMTPDDATFRILIDHYAINSGDLNRLSVLLNDMTDLGISMSSLYFRLVFKGFYIHGGSKYSSWTPRKLDIVWQACLKGMWARRNHKQSVNNPNRYEQRASDYIDEDDGVVEEEREEGKNEDRGVEEDTDEDEGVEWADTDGPKRKKTHYIYMGSSGSCEAPKGGLDLSGESEASDQHPWQTFVDEFSASTKGSESTNSLTPSTKNSTTSSFFTSRNFTSSTKSESDIASSFSQRQAETSSNPDEEADVDPASILPLPGLLQIPSDYRPSGYIKPSLALIMWILRAHTKVTGRREKIEDVWWECKKVWRAKNELEKEKILGILERCLKDCDRRAGYYPSI